MSKKFIQFEIVTPEKTVLKDSVQQITVPTKQGEITVLPDHIPLVASLCPGIIEIVKESGGRDVMSVSGGFIEILKNKVVILADTAERAEEIDIDRTEESRKRAEESIKDIRSMDREQFTNISAQIAKELARTKAVRKWKNISGIKER